MLFRSVSSDLDVSAGNSPPDPALTSRSDDTAGAPASLAWRKKFQISDYRLPRAVEPTRSAHALVIQSCRSALCMSALCMTAQAAVAWVIAIGFFSFEEPVRVEPWVLGMSAFCPPSPVPCQPSPSPG